MKNRVEKLIGQLGGRNCLGLSYRQSPVAELRSAKRSGISREEFVGVKERNVPSEGGAHRSGRNLGYGEVSRFVDGNKGCERLRPARNGHGILRDRKGQTSLLSSPGSRPQSGWEKGS